MRRGGGGGVKGTLGWFEGHPGVGGEGWDDGVVPRPIGGDLGHLEACGGVLWGMLGV